MNMHAIAIQPTVRPNGWANQSERDRERERQRKWKLWIEQAASERVSEWVRKVAVFYVACNDNKVTAAGQISIMTCCMREFAHAKIQAIEDKVSS